jgi:hypothetical protein
MSLQIETQPFQFNSTVLGLSSAVFNSVSAVSLSGIHYGDGSKLTGIVSPAGLYLPLSGGTVTGETRFNNNVTVFGNLTATGTTTFANTIFSVTSSLSVIHVGSGPALYVGNNGSGDIASFYDIDQNVEVLHVGGINSTFPNVGIRTSSPNKAFTVVGEISATSDITTSGRFLVQGSGNSDQWNSAYTVATTYQNTSGTFLTTSSAESLYAKLSSNAYTFDPSVSSIDTVYGINNATGIFSGVLGGNCNLASGNYSTLVNGFSSCATGYATFVGAGSGIRATGDYSVVVGGVKNTASNCYSIVGGGQCNIASGKNSFIGAGNNLTASGSWSVVVGGGGGGGFNTASANYSIVVGGKQNCITGTNEFGIIVGGCGNCLCTSGTATGSVIVGGNAHRHTYSGYSFIGGGLRNVTCSQFGAATNINNAVVVGGTCNIVSNNYSIIGGGLGNYNPLRDSQIVGGVVNHTGGYAPIAVTNAALSGNGSCTQINFGANCTSCFSTAGSTNLVSIYYSTSAIPLSAGCFAIASICASTGNCLIISGDYTVSPVTSATCLYVYDRTLNQTGYDNFIGGGKLNTASGIYGVVGGGKCNTNSGCYGVIGGGIGNVIAVAGGFGCGLTVGGGVGNCATGQFATVAGGCQNFAGQISFVGGGCGNFACGAYSGITAGRNNVVPSVASYAGISVGRLNTASGLYSTIVGGCCNTSSGCFSIIGNGKLNTASGTYSFVAGGFGNFNPLRSSTIGGGDFNHTGGYCATPIGNTSNPTNLATAQLSGNGTNTVINLGGVFGSCFSTTGTNAVSIVYTTSGAPLSAGNFAVANIVSQPNTTCIIVNGDYSVNQNSSASLSATCMFVYDRLLNQNGFHSTIGGGKLNTASGQYDVVVGGIRNSAIGSCSFVGGGFRNFAQNIASVVGGGCQNTASGQYASILGGIGNTAVGRTAGVGAGSSNCANGNCSFIGGGISNNTGANSTSFIGGGNTNVACGTSSNIVGGQSNTITSVGNCSTIAGGRSNVISSEHSFIASGSANDTKGFTNTFILGTGLSATQVNYTYVNNISAQSTISAPSISAVTFYGDGSKLTGITSSGGSGLYLPLSGGTMTGGLSAPSLSANNFYGSGSETILSDGISSNNVGQGTNTLSLNFSNGVYIGGNGSLNATTVNANNVTNYFYLTANGPAILTTITNFFSSGTTSSSLIDTLSANSVYDIEYHLLMQKTTFSATVVVTLSANAGASSFSNVGFGAIYQPAAAAQNSIVSGTGPTFALTSPSLATAAGYYYHIYKAFVQTGSIAPKVTINLTSTSGSTTPQVGSHRKLVKIV